MTVETYLNPVTNLPNRLGEIFSDRNIRVYGQAKLIGSTQIQTLGVQILVTPIDGGSESITYVPDGTYTMSGVGSTLWARIRRTSGTKTLVYGVDLLSFAAGAQPKPGQDWVQVFYRTGATEVAAISSFLIWPGPGYTRLGYGSGQRIFDAIVGDDAHSTHADLQSAINEANDGGWILVRKNVSVASMITTASKTLKFLFQGSQAGLTAASGATTGIQLQAPGCQLIGCGTISGFTTAVDLNGLTNATGARIEMKFSGNTVNVNTVSVSTSTPTIIIDSYSYASAPSVSGFVLGSTGSFGYGQKMVTLASSMTATHMKFYLQKAGSPVGTLTPYIYTDSAGLPSASMGSMPGILASSLSGTLTTTASLGGTLLSTPSLTVSNWISQTFSAATAGVVQSAAFLSATPIPGGLSGIITPKIRLYSPATSPAWFAAYGLTAGNQVTTLAPSGNNMYVGGVFTSAGLVSANYIAMWDGLTTWSALGTGLNNYPNAIAIYGSNVYVGGAFTTAGGSPANYIAVWNGSTWAQVGSGLGGPVYSLAVDSSGNLYAGGNFSGYISKWNGATWATVGTGANGIVNAIAISGTNVYAAGQFTTAGGSPANRIAVWNGATWAALGTGLNGNAAALAISGSNVYVGGAFTTAGGSPANYIARWNGATWTALGSGLNLNTISLAMSGSNLYVGGAFTTAGGSPANYIAVWNGSTWSALGSGADNGVQAIAIGTGNNSTNVYCGGSFTGVGGTVAKYLAWWNTLSGVLVTTGSSIAASSLSGQTSFVLPFGSGWLSSGTPYYMILESTASNSSPLLQLGSYAASSWPQYTSASSGVSWGETNRTTSMLVSVNPPIQCTFSGSIALPAGTYHSVLLSDATYRAGYSSANNAGIAVANVTVSSTPFMCVSNSGIWSSVSSERLIFETDQILTTTISNFLPSNLYSLEGSIGLTETAHIETSASDGHMARWNNPKKRWEPIVNIGGKTITMSSGGVLTITSGSNSFTMDANGNIVTTASMTGPSFLGAVYYS